MEFRGEAGVSDQPTILTEIWRGVLATGIISTAGWGAAGGVTSALAVRVRSRDALRQIALGALVAGGSGTLAMALLVRFAGLPAEAIPITGAGSSASYFVGVFGPAIIEVILRRIRGGRLPGERSGDGS